MSARAYEDTRVPVERTKEMIRLLFRKHKVEGFRFTEDWKAHTVGIEFVRSEISKRDGGTPVEVRIPVRMMIPVAEGHYERRHYTQAGWERRERQVWRALYFYLKSQLEAVEFGLRSLTDAFLADIVMKSGLTIGDQVKGQLLTGQLALPDVATPGSP